MTYDFLTDSNLIETKTSEYAPIPVGTIVKVAVTIRPGGHGPDGFLTQNPKSGSVYINGEFTVTEGQYARRKIFQCIGIQGTKPNDTWSKNGKQMFKSIIESARNISPIDSSEEARNNRKLSSLGDLDGLECAVRLGIEHDRAGKYPPKNVILSVITPDHKEYQSVMNPSNSQKPLHDWGSDLEDF